MHRVQSAKMLCEILTGRVLGQRLVPERGHVEAARAREPLLDLLLDGQQALREIDVEGQVGVAVEQLPPGVEPDRGEAGLS